MNLIIRKEKRYKSITGIIEAIVPSLLLTLFLEIVPIGAYINPPSYDVRYLIASFIIAFLPIFVFFLRIDRVIGYNICSLPNEFIEVRKCHVEGMYEITIKGVPEGYGYYDNYDSNKYRYFYLSNITTFLGGTTYNIWDKHKYVGNYRGNLSYEQYRYLARKGEGL